MFEVTLQIVSAVILAALAIRIRITTRQHAQLDLNEILSHFRGGHGDLLKLANMSQQSDCDHPNASELWTAIGGVRGSWKMYNNIGVLFETVDFVSSRCSTEPSLAEQLARARAELRSAQIIVASILVCTVASPLRKLFLISSARAYLTALQTVSRVIEDSSPNMARRYRYFITRDPLVIGC
jgi:hypothetical protein